MADRETMYRDSVRRVFAGETALLCMFLTSAFLAVSRAILVAGIMIFLAGFCVSCDRYFRWRYQDGRRHKILMLWGVFVLAAGAWLLSAPDLARGIGGVVAGAFLLTFLGQPVMMARQRGWKLLTLGTASGLCTLAGCAGIAFLFVADQPMRPFVKEVLLALLFLMPLLLAAGRSLRGRFLAGMAEVPYEKLRTPVVNGIWIVTLLLVLGATFVSFLAYVVPLR